jgi:predicted DNA binding CopG/RHH family protein
MDETITLCINSVKRYWPKTRYRQIARNAARKGKRVNIRISSQNLELLQARALCEGIPYQTLMASILHKYVHGTLAERQQAQG